ncbi:hypothetical protein Hdeb2414_s0018g00515941 [Helianthus debilis subsp. tardiflorus]
MIVLTGFKGSLNLGVNVKMITGAFGLHFFYSFEVNHISLNNVISFARKLTRIGGQHT